MLSLSLLGIHGLQKADLSRHRTMKNKLLFLCVRLWENSITYWFRKNIWGKKIFQTRPRPRNFFRGCPLPLKNFPRWVRSGEVSAAARPELIPSIIAASPTPRLVRAQPVFLSPQTPRPCFPPPRSPARPHFLPRPRAPLRGPALEPAYSYYW